MNRVKEIRERKGLTQQELAFKTGIAIRTISRIETGHSRGSPVIRKALADALVFPEDLLFPEDERAAV